MSVSATVSVFGADGTIDVDVAQAGSLSVLLVAFRSDDGRVVVTLDVDNVHNVAEALESAAAKLRSLVAKEPADRKRRPAHQGNPAFFGNSIDR